ncbi:hypothetical protein CfB38_1813 [Citrobacter freundii]|jgi:hypothetical protein|nr:hypothetical protein CfB38_1813 [Citrobacter freundii]MCS3462631.1 hypothetical protein [Citrobacter sp. JUb117]
MKMKQSFQKNQPKTIKDFFVSEKIKSREKSSDRNSFFQRLLENNHNA